MDDELFMRKAIALSKAAAEHGNEPFGAVLVKDGEIVFTNENQVHTRHDPTFHGEAGLIREFYGPAPIRGRICMDMCMVDLTDLPEVKVGDTVELFGQRQSVGSLAALLDTIPYELTCAVNKRVPRVYMENGQEIERSLRLL